MSCIPYSSETVVIQCNRVAHLMSAAEFSNDLLDVSSGSEYIYTSYTWWMGWKWPRKQWIFTNKEKNVIPEILWRKNWVKNPMPES